MNLLQIFNKKTGYKKFNYTPRFYNPEEEERKERIRRIENEVNAAKSTPAEEVPSEGVDAGYRGRIRGSFQKARVANGSVPSNSGTSPALLRLAILLVLTLGFIGYLQYGKGALYGIALVLIPLYLFLRFRKLNNKGR
jgi:hypothetical protein